MQAGNIQCVQCLVAGGGGGGVEGGHAKRVKGLVAEALLPLLQWYKAYSMGSLAPNSKP